jgi:hypothetical protein
MHLVSHLARVRMSDVSFTRSQSLSSLIISSRHDLRGYRWLIAYNICETGHTGGVAFEYPGILGLRGAKAIINIKLCSLRLTISMRS